MKIGKRLCRFKADHYNYEPICRVADMMNITINARIQIVKILDIIVYDNIYSIYSNIYDIDRTDLYGF